MGIVMPETCWAVSVWQSNKILWLVVASSWVFYLSLITASGFIHVCCWLLQPTTTHLYAAVLDDRQSALKEGTIDNARIHSYNKVYYLGRIRPTFYYCKRSLVSTDRNILLKDRHFYSPVDVLQDEHVDPSRALCKLLSKMNLAHGQGTPTRT